MAKKCVAPRSQTQAGNRNDNKNDRAPDPVDGYVCVCGVEWLRRCMVHGGADQISLSLSAALECTKAERVHAQRARNKGERTP